MAVSTAPYRAVAFICLSVESIMSFVRRNVNERECCAFVQFGITVK